MWFQFVIQIRVWIKQIVPPVSYPNPLSNRRAVLVPRFDADVVGLLIPRLDTDIVLVAPLHLGCKLIKILTLPCCIIPSWGSWRRRFHL